MSEWRLFSAAVAVAMTTTACATGSTPASTTTAAPTTTTTTGETTTTAQPTTTSTATGPAPPAVFDPTAQELTKEGQPLDPGTYLVNTLGIAMSLTVGEDWHVQPNSAARFVLSDPASSGPGDRDIVFLRPTALADPDAPNAPRDQQEGWPIEDIRGWLDNLIGGVVDGEPLETTLGGLPAVMFDVSLGDSVDCGPEFCVGFADNRGVNGLWFDPDVAYRVWWVDTGDFHPVAISVGTGRIGPEWFTTAQEVLDTVAFDEPGPHPFPEGDLCELGYPAECPAGRVTLPFGGGVSFVLEEDRFIYQEPGFVDLPLRLPGGVEFVLPRFSPDGTALASVEDVIGALRDWPLDLTELDPTTVAGAPTRVFDLTDGPRSFLSPAVTWDEDIPGWFPPRAARIWLLDTERGVIMITAESFETDLALPDAIALAESVIATLELVELE